MKKQLIIATLALGAIVFGTDNVQAQAVATTTVNIILSDVISIDSGSIANGGLVEFNYNTAEDYNMGLGAVNVENSLIVTSTKNFDIKVKADGPNFTDGTNNIPVDVLTIKAATGGSMAGTQNLIVLSDTDQVLIANAPLGSALSLNLSYDIPAAKSSSSDILGKPAGTYVQTVTYTATAL